MCWCIEMVDQPMRFPVRRSASCRLMGNRGSFFQVVIIGEMDVPGHASGLTGPLPAVFGFKSKPGLGVINFVDPAVVAAVRHRLSLPFNHLSRDGPLSSP